MISGKPYGATLKYTEDSHLAFPEIVRFSVNHREKLILSLTRLSFPTADWSPVPYHDWGSPLGKSIAGTCCDESREDHVRSC